MLKKRARGRGAGGKGERLGRKIQVGSGSLDAGWGGLLQKGMLGSVAWLGRGQVGIREACLAGERVAAWGAGWAEEAGPAGEEGINGQSKPG